LAWDHQPLLLEVPWVVQSSAAVAEEVVDVVAGSCPLEVEQTCSVVVSQVEGRLPQICWACWDYASGPGSLEAGQGSWMVVAETLGLHQRRVEHSAAWYSSSQVALLVQAVAESPDAWTSAVDHSHAEEQLEACVR